MKYKRVVGKLTPKLYKDPLNLLRKAGAVVGNQPYPSAVFVHPDDYETMRSTLKKSIIRNSGMNSNFYDFQVEAHLLDYGPVEDISVKLGTYEVDERKINNGSPIKDKFNKDLKDMLDD